MSNQTQSVIATLESRATTESATAGASASLKTGNVITGQYLFDRFCNNKADITKMAIVENAVTGGVTVDEFKTATKDMVAIAEKHSEATKKTAANHSSVLRNVFGAWKFKHDEYVQAGFIAGSTGYHVANTLAKQVLKDAGIRWTGEQGKTPEQRQADADKRLALQALKEAADSTPVIEGENQLERNLRILENANKLEATAREEAQAKKVAKIVESVKAMSGDLITLVIAALCEEEGLQVEYIVENKETATA